MTTFERWSVWTTSLLTVATGVGYFWTKYLVTSPDPYAVVNHPLQPFFLKAHIVVSPLLLFALGLIAVRHVWKHFRSGVQWSRKSGLTAALSVVPMVLTGYLIQVLSSAGWVQAMAVAHVAFGALYAVGAGLHGWVLRRSPAPNGRASASRDAAAGAAAGEEAVEDPPAGGDGASPEPATPGASRTVAGPRAVGTETD